MAAFVCFAMNCVFMQVTSKLPPNDTRLANLVVGWASLAALFAGVGAGVAAIIGGWRKQDRDTVAIAAMGLLLSGATMLLMLWMLYQIGRAR